MDKNRQNQWTKRGYYLWTKRGYYLLVFITFFVLLFLGSRWLIPSSPVLNDLSFSQVVYDDHHRVLRITLSKDEKYRIFTPLEEISPLLVQATLLQEDQYFFSHPGINPIALVKAAWQTYVVHSRPIGASTITMQLARLRENLYTKNTTGKLWQILKAFQLEIFYSKQQILEAYLNLVSYGGNIEGIGAASLIYFDKTAKQLNLPEALELSVIPQNPIRRKPLLANVNHVQTARQKLFERWVKIHIEDALQQDLIDLPLQLIKNLPFHAPHFVDSILKQNNHPQVFTTLNLELQTIAENITLQYLQKHEELGLKNAAVMLADTRNLAIKVAVGSGNYFDHEIHGQINGTQIKRSPGSTLKPFIFALALDQGLIHPCSLLNDIPSSFSGYNPGNFDNKFLGPLKAKDALVLSRNIPALFLAQQLKSPSLYQFLHQASISRLKPEMSYGLSIVLGSAELTMQELVGLYAMLVNHGIWRPLCTTTEHKAPSGTSLLSPEASFLTLDMLRETPRPYKNAINNNEQLPIYWKTGTSSGYRDGWAIGVFGPYVLAVWVGDFDNKSHTAFIGTKSAAPLFFNIIDAVSKHAGPLSNLVEATSEMNLTQIMVCEATGSLPTHKETSNLVNTWFIPGKSPIRHEDDDAPKITSPKKDTVYALQLSKMENIILFNADASCDADTLYWFIDDHYEGKTKRDQSLSWEAKSGSFFVRAIDDLGRSSTQQLIVEVIK